MNAFVTAGFDLVALFDISLRSNDEIAGSGDGVDGKFGDPSVVLYPGGWSSPNNDDKSRSPTFSERDGFVFADRQNLRVSHFPVSRPMSRRYFFSACVSSRNKIPITTPQATIEVHTRFGSR